ncbi:MAG: (5-formylfuran-3-yl)methyl phosphate synthase, partial [Deltaproteobacteria bacterium]
PRLLVSVRNAAEAEAALVGGCDVLDVKEPARGAMGMADPTAIAAVVARVGASHSSVPVSVALGEVAEWEGMPAVPRLPARIAYVKLGTAGLGSDAGWGRRLADVKRRFAADWRETASDTEPDSVKWIAVGYADWESARGPCPAEVIDGAHECGCAGVLIDTFSKERGRLIDWLSIERLESLAALARSSSLEFALAGRLHVGDLPGIGAVCPDIVGIRSAACRAGIRTAEIDAAAVRSFREALQVSWSTLAPARSPVHPGGVRIAPRA